MGGGGVVKALGALSFLLSLRQPSLTPPAKEHLFSGTSSLAIACHEDGRVLSLHGTKHY